MKTFISLFAPLMVLAAATFFITACSNETEQTPDGDFHGEAFQLADNPKTPAELAADMGEDKIKSVQVSGKIVEVCQNKGCWMTLDTGNENLIRITFRDYGFFVPKDISGKEVIIAGDAWMEKTAARTLRHYAEDAGKPQEEIDAITEDKLEYHFEATGVFIRS